MDYTDMSCLSFAITGAYGGIGTCGEIYNRDGCGDPWEDRGMPVEFVLYFIQYYTCLPLVWVLRDGRRVE